jgi:hypothetical protein
MEDRAIAAACASLAPEAVLVADCATSVMSRDVGGTLCGFVHVAGDLVRGGGLFRARMEERRDSGGLIRPNSRDRPDPLRRFWPVGLIYGRGVPAGAGAGGFGGAVPFTRTAAAGCAAVAVGVYAGIGLVATARNHCHSAAASSWVMNRIAGIISPFSAASMGLYAT